MALRGESGCLGRAAGPELTLGADVMVGFPGETDAEFEETLEFVRALPFGYLHLFPFSPRPGTRAWALHKEHPVPRAVVDERMAAYACTGRRKNLTHIEGDLSGASLMRSRCTRPRHCVRLGRTDRL